MIRITITSDRIGEGKTTVACLIRHALRMADLECEIENPDGDTEITQDKLPQRFATLRARTEPVRVLLVEKHEKPDVPANAG